MNFKLVYTTEKGLWHARLRNSAGTILFWTKESTSKQVIVGICDEVRRGMNVDVPIYEADY